MTAETRRRVRIEIRAAELAARHANGESYFPWWGVPYDIDVGWRTHYHHCAQSNDRAQAADLSTANHEVGYLARQIIYGDDA